MPPKSKVGVAKKVCCSATCNEPATQTDMIACSACKKWWHKECGVISDEVNELNEPWQCTNCKPPPKPTSTATSSSSRRARIDLKLKQLEESRALKEKELAFERKFLEEKQRLMEEQLDAEQEEDMMGIPRSRAGDRAGDRVEDWLMGSEQPAEQKAISDEITRMRQQLTDLEQKPLFEPTKAQLAARHALPKELPTFSGDPKEWTLFIANYNYSTEACGYQDYENLIRLQRALKGAALESVRSRLLLPNSVSKVIETLTKRFGRPELVIDTLLEKIATLPPPRGDKLESMIEFGTAVQALSDHIVAVGMLEHLHNPTLIKSLIVKLPAEYKMKWAEYNRNNSRSNLQTFARYMEEVVDDASSVTFQSMAKEKSTKGQPHRVLVHTNTNRYMGKACFVCKQDGHKIEQCTQFQAMSTKERWQTIKSMKLCRTCLNMHKFPCNRMNTCGLNNCTARHHQLLHYKPAESEKKDEEASAPVTIAYHNQEENGFYKMICVTLYNGDKELDILAFIDEGSSLTLLEEEVTNSLGLQGRVKPLCLKWTANVTREERNSKQVSFKVSGRGQNRQYTMNGVRTVESLDLPEQSMELQNLKERYNYLRNIPLCSYNREKPKMLIGLDNISLIVPQKIKEGSSGHPTAVKTRLGWCLYGGKQTDTNSCHYHSCNCDDDQSMDKELKRYFAMEEVAIKSTTPITSAEEQRALEILRSSTKYVGERYESGLLWKYEEVNLPDSYKNALRRLECFERKLHRTDDWKERVETQIQEYVQKGYAHIADEEELQKAKPNRIWYLPLGVVVNPKKPEKARLIWDASSKVNGISLNSVLLKGPDQLCTLPTILFRFRQYPVAVSADIKEMFHQIRIIEADKQSQRFLWRSDPEKRPDTYIMDVATFGATCSPATAQYIKNHNALRFTKEYPRAVEAITQNHYVDDYLDSFETQPEAILIAKQVIAIHQKGGFTIRGWCSNIKSVVESLGGQVATNSKEIKTHNFENHAEKVLGLRWDTQHDEFYFPTTMTNEIAELIKSRKIPTKREILRCVMTLFDPLGTLAPYLIQGKMLVQDTWRDGTLWDEQITDKLIPKWYKWLNTLGNIAEVRVPRCYLHQASCQETVSGGQRGVELHTFVDASELAYACVSYFRFINDDKTIKVAQVMAKAKVAPVKILTIPRLELQGCVQGARMAKYVTEGHSYREMQRYFWTDSSTALSWIHSDPKKYRPFVAHRVGEILELTDRQEWYWVPTKQNPADEATRWGADLTKLNSIWLRGPPFLYQPPTEWPKQGLIGEGKTEIRTCLVHWESQASSLINWSHFSKYSRLLNSTAYALRAASNFKLLKLKLKLSNSPLCKEEYMKAEQTLLREAQAESFPEISIIKQGKVPGNLNQHSLFRLSPILDENGVLRMHGRIDAIADAHVENKQPIILSPGHRLTALILDHIHRKYVHANNESVVNEVRQRYFIPKLRAAVKKIGRQCQFCKVKKAVPVIPEMGQLPAARLSPFIRPFSYVGMDYFGPIQVKIGRSHSKRWVALFTCMTVRAIHLEVAHSLTTESCIKAVRRFISRRGSPLEIYSDNGTNFKGAEKILAKQILAETGETFTNNTTAWRFITPGSPHMGGCWERLIRSVKVSLQAVHNGDVFSEEDLQTALAEAEAIVNSRPLTYLPLDSEEHEALTPNHFLLGTTSGERKASQGDISGATTVLRTWTGINANLDRFWKRWTMEYLPTLTKRTKWFLPTKNLTKGDLVVIIDENSRNKWTRGRILETFAGKDGIVRQAAVQTSSGIYKRPVAKLAVLEVGGGETSPVLGSSTVGRMLRE